MTLRGLLSSTEHTAKSNACLKERGPDCSPERTFWQGTRCLSWHCVFLHTRLRVGRIPCGQCELLKLGFWKQHGQEMLVKQFKRGKCLEGSGELCGGQTYCVAPPRLGQLTDPLGLAFCICRKGKCSLQVRSVRIGEDECKASRTQKEGGWETSLTGE